MRALITGGAGFIGSHLCDRLLQEGWEVVCVDNFITGSRSNLAPLVGQRSFRLLEQDVTRFLEVREPLEAVLHLASPASPKDFSRIPIQILKAGALGTHNALGLAKAKGAKFLLASTSEVYGDAREHPQRETYWGWVNPIGVRGVYDESKRFAEALTMAYHRNHGLDTRIARIFNTYGPRMRVDDGRAIPNFFTQALAGSDLTVYGQGQQTRSFCYVDDLVEGLWRLLRSDVHEPVNLGNPEEITIGELAERIRGLAGSRSGIVHREAPPDDPGRRCPDIARAQRLLGWRPRVSLQEGLERTLAYFRPAVASG
ncbi:SDR family oxidoreductase [Acidobacteriia bacterium AH_259_A11_L15]|nr:SDR family oxidoreductase [Acidobacteriia bacterium AH_259_A11_L15]